MALHAGTHVWPDANHRTALLSFGLAATRAFDLEVVLDPRTAADLVLKSKAMRDGDYVARGRYYSLSELADARHRYRVLVSSYESALIVRSL